MYLLKKGFHYQYRDLIFKCCVKHKKLLVNSLMLGAILFMSRSVYIGNAYSLEDCVHNMMHIESNYWHTFYFSDQVQWTLKYFVHVRNFWGADREEIMGWNLIRVDDKFQKKKK